MKVVTVHRGARDGYQVSRALNEAGILQALVTDLYWPSDCGWAHGIEKISPRGVAGALKSRCVRGLPGKTVSSDWVSGLGSLAANKARFVPFDLSRRATRWCDKRLGQHAGCLAAKTGSALLSYSYYAFSAFSNFHGVQPRILFQLHPHPASVRSILKRERLLHPECASSLDKEWELALPESDFRKLVDEVKLAQHWIVASNFTKQTLIDNQIPSDRVTVIPYGVDAKRFPNTKETSKGPVLHLLFVGTLGQRKGIRYLLEAMRLLPRGSVRLTVCGRAVDDLQIFKDYGVPVELKVAISNQELRMAYQNADVFVFPSLAEGFAHVLLEAMASGLPIISTTRTAASDLIRHGREGFIIRPGDPGDIAIHIEEFVRNPNLARSMGEAARRRAEYFTWDRFRHQIVDVVQDILNHPPTTSVPA